LSQSHEPNFLALFRPCPNPALPISRRLAQPGAND
jgi:hypothetical protein